MKIGRSSENVLKRSILQQIKTKRKEVLVGAGLGEDCAIFSFSGEAGSASEGQVFSGRSADTKENDGCVMISCARESAVWTEQREPVNVEAVPVSYLLMDCVNALAACGAAAVAVSLGILLPLDTEEEVLREIMTEAEAACAEQGVQLAQARGRVTAAAAEPFATITAYGTVYETAAEAIPAAYHTVKAARPGHDIVISKWIGLEGTAILARRHRDSLLGRYPAWFVEKAAAFDTYRSAVPEAAVAVKSGVCAMHLISEGGVLAALWELAEGAGVGLTIDLKKLPIRQETVEICNHCNINPYELLSGGSFLMTSADGPGLVAALEAAGIPAVMVGKITDSNDRLILNEDEVRYLDRPREDSIYEKGEWK